MIPALQVVLAILLWSTSGPFVRASGLSVANFITIANASGIGLLLLIFPRRIRAGLPTIPRRTLFRLSCAGIVNVWTSYVAFGLTSVGNVIIFHYAAPVLVAVAAPFFLREKPEKRTWEALGLSLVGMVLCAWRDVSLGGRSDLIGIALSLASAVAYAVAIIESRTLARAGADSFAVIVAQSGALSLVTLPFFSPSTLDFRGASLAAAAGFLHLTCAAGLYLTGLKRVKAATAAVMGYLEIVFGLGWGLWLFHEPITSWKVVGASAIVAAGLILVRRADETPAPTALPGV